MDLAALRRILLTSTLVAILVGFSGGGGALAHRQTVTPPGQDAPVIDDDPISNSWAQAHCNANAPSVVAEASNGVVEFNPPDALDCPATPNPGGKVHPHAE